MAALEKQGNPLSFASALDEAELVRNEERLNWIRLLLFSGLVFFEAGFWLFSVGPETFFASAEFALTLLVFLVIPGRLVFFLRYFKRSAKSVSVSVWSGAFLALDHSVWVLLAIQGASDPVRFFIEYLFLAPYTIITQVSLNPGYSLTSASFGILAFAFVAATRILPLEGQSVFEWTVISLILGFMLIVNALVTLYLSRYHLSRYLQMKEYQRSLTEQRDMIKQSEELTRGLYARVSHDLRTPLHGVIGMAGLLQESGPTGEQEEFIAGIRGSAESLLGLINNILDKAKIDAGYFHPESRVFSLQETLALVGRNVRHSIGNRDIGFEVKVDPGVGEFLVGDQARLMQILFNLLGNAVKFTPSGTVTLSVARNGGHAASGEEDAAAGSGCNDSRCTLTFAVSDTGIGMPADMLGTIFEEYRQINPGDRIRGSGLGLAITRELVTLLGGTIDVVSEPGKGSTFTFVLPYELPRHAAPRTPAGQLNLFGQSVAPGTHLLRVLIVDDSAVNRQIMERMVQKAGGQPFPVDSGEAAIARLGLEHHDLVLLDYEMPGMHGLEVVSAYRESLRAGSADAAGAGESAEAPGSLQAKSPKTTEPKFVLVTGHGKELFQDMNVPADVDIIEKPLRLSQIRELVAELAAGRKH